MTSSGPKWWKTPTASRNLERWRCRRFDWTAVNQVIWILYSAAAGWLQTKSDRRTYYKNSKTTLCAQTEKSKKQLYLARKMTSQSPKKDDKFSSPSTAPKFKLDMFPKKDDMVPFASAFLRPLWNAGKVVTENQWDIDSFGENMHKWMKWSVEVVVRGGATQAMNNAQSQFLTIEVPSCA